MASLAPAIHVAVKKSFYFTSIFLTSRLNNTKISAFKMSLSTNHCQKIKATLPALNDRGEQVASVFYKCLLSGHPELRKYFNLANQYNKVQPRAMANLLIDFAKNVSHIYDLIPKMERICHRHCSVGVQPEHYNIMGRHLVEAITSILDPSMTPEAKMAWTNAYWAMANMFIMREQQLYKTFDGWTRWRKMEVINRVNEGEDIVSFYLRPVHGPAVPVFMPGQYISVRVAIPGKQYKQIRQYALSDAPHHDYYRITVKRQPGITDTEVKPSGCPYAAPPGAMSNHLVGHIDVGDVVEASHPAGHLFLDIENLATGPIVLIASGMGATPMMSILNFVLNWQPKRQVTWLSISSAPMPFQQYVARMASLRKNLRLKTLDNSSDADSGIDCAASQHSVIRLASLEEDDLHLSDECTEYYICGAEHITAQVLEYLENNGVSQSRIKCEHQGVAR